MRSKGLQWAQLLWINAQPLLKTANRVDHVGTCVDWTLQTGTGAAAVQHGCLSWWGGGLNLSSHRTTGNTCGAGWRQHPPRIVVCGDRTLIPRWTSLRYMMSSLAPTGSDSDTFPDVIWGLCFNTRQLLAVVSTVGPHLHLRHVTKRSD